MRRNVDAVAGAERRRLLVLADTTCPALEICDSIVAALAGPNPEVLVVAPVLASPLHYLLDDETAERADAEARLAAVVDGLRAAGIDARGRIGDDDPVQALGDALAEFPAVEALVVTSTETHWLEARPLRARTPARAGASARADRRARPPLNRNGADMTSIKERDLAGPGIGDYAELAHELPADYASLLGPKETMQALYAAKRLIEDRLSEELNLTSCRCR